MVCREQQPHPLIQRNLRVGDRLSILVHHAPANFSAMPQLDRIFLSQQRQFLIHPFSLKRDEIGLLRHIAQPLQIRGGVRDRGPAVPVGERFLLDGIPAEVIQGDADGDSVQRGSTIEVRYPDAKVPLMGADQG